MTSGTKIACRSVKRDRRIVPAVILAMACWPAGAIAGDGAEGGLAAASSGFADVDGGRVFYEAAGRGPAVVMIHDGLIHRETWDAQFEAFSRGHRVVRWDRRGYGRSDPPAAPFSNRDDLLAVMNAAGVERAAVMGCSSGSLLAMEFALAHPERVSALILVGPITSGLEFSGHFRTRGHRGMPGRDAPTAEQIEYWSVIDPWIMAPESTAARARMKALLEANPQNMTGSRGFARPPRQPTRPRLPEIAVPVLILAGEADIPDVHTHIGVIQSAIPGARRVVLEHSGHLCHMEQPEAFNREVLGFLSALDPKDR